LSNLVDFITICIDHARAANQTFLVSDGEDLSTPELVRRIGMALNRTAHLLPVPVLILKAGAALLGRQDLCQRICGNLQVDITRSSHVLHWHPPISVDDGLRRAVGRKP